jgi:transposase
MALKASPKLFADETTAPVLDPGRGRTKLGQLWAYARDDRPWGGTDQPGVVYIYAPGRKAERPISHLAGFKGVLQVDGYSGYRVLADRGDVQLAFCWSHVRRRFYELAAAGPAPIASEALERIASLYAVEKEIRGRGALEPLRRQCGIACRVLDVAMPEIGLDRARVVAVVGELVTAGMAEHVGVPFTAVSVYP